MSGNGRVYIRGLINRMMQALERDHDFKTFTACDKSVLACFQDDAAAVLRQKPSVNEALDVFFWLTKCSQGSGFQLKPGLIREYLDIFRSERRIEIGPKLVRIFEQLRNKQKLNQKDELQIEINKTFETLLETYTNVLMKRHEHLKLPDMCRILCSLARRRPVNEALFKVLGDLVVRDFDKVREQDNQFMDSAAFMLVAFAQAEIQHPALFDRVAQYFIDNTEHSAYGVIALVSYALSYMPQGTECEEQCWQAIIRYVESQSTHFTLRGLSVIASSAFRAGRNDDVRRITQYFLSREAEFDFHVVSELALMANMVGEMDLISRKVELLIKNFPPTYLASTFEAMAQQHAPISTLHALADELVLKMRNCSPADMVKVSQTMTSENLPSNLPFDSLSFVLQRETVRRLDEFSREDLGPVGRAVKKGVVRDWFFPCLEAHYHSLGTVSHTPLQAPIRNFSALHLT